jgi:hypothetical protein
MKELKWTFPSVGCLAVSYVENSIRTYCFEHGYEFSIEKGSGILYKPMWISITVPENDVMMVKSDIYYMFSED